MNPLAHPTSITFALVTAFGVIVPLPLPLKLAVVAIGGVGWLASVALLSITQARPQETEDDLSNDARALLRPLRKLHEELAAIVAQNSDMPAVKVVGGEALAESSAILDHAQKLLDIREQLRRTYKGKSEAEIELKSLEGKLNRAGTEAERIALQRAVEAKRDEIARYADVADAMAGVDGKLAEAQAALSELKARIAVGAAGARTQGLEQDELTDMVGRLKSLSKSFDEAETSLRMHVP